MTTMLRGATVRRYLEALRDASNISGATQAINAVRTSIEMAPALDAALDAVLAETLDIDRG